MNKELLRRSIRIHARAGFSRSGGHGGQNVNKVNTKVTLRINLRDLEGLISAEIIRMGEILAPRLTKEGEMIIFSSEERSRQINLERAFCRMENMITAAVRLPKFRFPTRPGRAAREERLKIKRIKSAKKAERRPFKEE